MSAPEQKNGMPLPHTPTTGPVRQDEGEDQARDPASQGTEPPQPAQEIPVSRPEAFRLRADPPKVMRLSRKALAIVGVTSCLTIGAMLIYALSAVRHTPPVNLIEAKHAAKSDVVTSAPGSYDKVPRLGPPLPGDLGRPILNALQNGQVIQPPPIATPGAATSNPQMVAAQQARQRLAQEGEAARGSRLFLAGSTVGSPGQQGAGIQDGASPTAPAPSPSATQASAASGAAGQAAKRAFLTTPASYTAISPQRAVTATSPYVLQAGSIIAAALITGIRSDLPGQITAQVTQNVYDSPTGRIVLIPQGSRLIGEYDSQVSSGQNRVLLAWDRLILPGGRSILLDRQPGADASGFAGLQDKVNYHWGNMLKAAAISTLLGVGTEMATDNNSTLVQALRYGTEDTINQVGKQLIQREVGVAPTLTIRPGFELRVIVTRDLIVEPQGEAR